MTNDSSTLRNLKQRKSVVRTAGSQPLFVEGIGDTTIYPNGNPLELKGVYFIPKISENLISQTLMRKQGVWQLPGLYGIFFKYLNGNIVYHRYTENNQIIIVDKGKPVDTAAEQANTATTPATQAAMPVTDVTMPSARPAPASLPPPPVVPHDPDFVHERFSHPGPKQQRAIINAYFSKSRSRPAAQCDPCTMGKLTKARLPAHSSSEKAQRPGERLCIDIISQFSGHSSYRFTLAIIDDATSYTHVEHLKNKGQAAQALIDFVTLIEKQSSGAHAVKIIRCDNDAVFTSSHVLAWAASIGIKWEYSTPNDSRLNGKIERMNRTLRERMLANLQCRAAPYSLWPEAMDYAAICLNLTPRDAADPSSSPYEKFWSRPAAPLARFTLPFGCLVWAFVPERKRAGGKGGPRSVPAIFLGIDDSHRGWKLYSEHARPTTFWSNSAKIYPDKRWLDRRGTANWQDALDHPMIYVDRDDHVGDLTFSHMDVIATRDKEALEAYREGPCPTPPAEQQYDITRDDDGALLVLDIEPEDYDDDDGEWRDFPIDAEAMKASEKPAGQEGKLNLTPSVEEALKGVHKAHFQDAIDREFDGCIEMGIFNIVDAPPNVKLIDSRLILRIKVDSDGYPIKYKARLVARGFAQREGKEFDETFAPVAPYTAMRAIVAVATARRWHMHATDFTQAYLNGTLDHAVYMKPPPGAPFKVPAGKVLQVVKGLYGLKQSGRVWNQHLDRLLRSLYFMPLESAACVYKRGEGDDLVLIAAYVDDLIMVGPNLALIESIKQQIKALIKMEDKGPISSFCGIKFDYDQSAGKTLLSQHGFINDVLSEEHQAQRRIQRRTPMTSPPPQTELDPQYQARFRSDVGKILWLSNHTRPDLSFAASTLSRHISSPSAVHVEASTRVFDYLKHTKDVKLEYLGNEAEGLEAYSDATWASDTTTDRKSTGGYCVFLFNCLVSWKTQVQRCVALSAVEAELVAASEAARELLFLKHLLKEIRIEVMPRLVTDSLGCVQVSKDPAQHWRLKHIETRYYFLRWNVQHKKIDIVHIAGPLNPADIFTKAVGIHNLARHRLNLGVVAGKKQEVESQRDGEG